MSESASHFMYVLRCADGSLYTGYTVDVPRRLRQHQAGKASRYTRTRRPLALAGWWQFETQRAAMQAEYDFKRLARAEKLRLIQLAEAEGG
ncbi:GIY-YIG nuclease superfamily protein [compost metagenome]